MTVEKNSKSLLSFHPRSPDPEPSTQGGSREVSLLQPELCLNFRQPAAPPLPTPPPRLGLGDPGHTA